MNISARSILMAGVATLTASAVVIAPSVQPAPPPAPPPAPAPTVQLVADVQLLALQQQPPLLNVLLTSPLALLGPAAPLGTVPPPPAPIQFAIAPNIADTIDNVYLAVEPWVQYGFEVATAVVRWIPWVGWFAGFIMDGYIFVEGMVASGAFNIADWLRGDGGAVENLVDFGIDVGLSFVWLGLDALDNFVPLPPFCCYPAHPPHEGRPGGLVALEALLDPTATPGVGEETSGSGLLGLIDRVLNPVDAEGDVDGDVDGALNGGATLSSLIRNGIAEIGDLLGVPSSPGELDKTEEVSTVPSIVKTPFAPLDSLPTRSGADIDEPEAGPLTEVTKTVRNVRKEIRADFNAATERRTERAAGNGVVRAQGELRGAVAKAANDVVNAVRGDKSDGAADDVAKAPSTVAKNLGDTARKVVKEVRQAAKDGREAAKDAREAAKDRVAADDE